jgi:hypothetical protein
VLRDQASIYTAETRLLTRDARETLAVASR